MSDLDGILPIDKPVGPTSHDIVAIARRALKMRRIGHTGTLDPFASGLLLLCLGPSTRLAEYLTALPKTYHATLRLGASTTTDDGDGEVVRTSDAWASIGVEQLKVAISHQTGNILQRPPAFSAKKVGGRRMYDVARQGGIVELDPVPVSITRAELTKFALPDAELEIDCSGGTYIRAIARDIGEELGVGGHLTRLRRTRIARFDVDDAIGLDDLTDSAAVSRALLSPAAAVAHLPALSLEPAEVKNVRHGKALIPPEPLASGVTVLRLLDSDGSLVAIGEVSDGRVRPRKVFA